MVSRKKQYAVPFSFTIAMAVLLTGLGLVGSCSKAKAQTQDTLYLLLSSISGSSPYTWNYVGVLDTSNSYITTSGGTNPTYSFITLTGIMSSPPTSSAFTWNPSDVSGLGGSLESSPPSELSGYAWTPYSPAISSATYGSTSYTIGLVGNSLSWKYTGSGGATTVYGSSLPSFSLGGLPYYYVGSFSFDSPVGESYLPSSPNTLTSSWSSSTVGGNNYNGNTRIDPAPAPVSGLQTALIGLFLGGGLLWKLRRRNSLRLA